MGRAFGILASIAVLAACSSVKVQTEYDRATKFADYQTYAYLPREPGPEQAPVARDPRIREAVVKSIDAALTKKGMRRVEMDQNPSMLVAVHGFANNRIEVQSYGYNFYPGLATTAVDVRQYRDGTLIIDLVDASSRQMIWRGTATDTFSPGAEAKTIANAIDKTLAEYPPPPPGK
jgi:hypothetical protein